MRRIMILSLLVACTTDHVVPLSEVTGLGASVDVTTIVGPDGAFSTTVDATITSDGCPILPKTLVATLNGEPMKVTPNIYNPDFSCNYTLLSYEGTTPFDVASIRYSDDTAMNGVDLLTTLATIDAAPVAPVDWSYTYGQPASVTWPAADLTTGYSAIVELQLQGSTFDAAATHNANGVMFTFHDLGGGPLDGVISIEMVDDQLSCGIDCSINSRRTFMHAASLHP